MSTLFSRFNLGELTLDNRVVVPPMRQYMANADGLPAPWHDMHYGSMAISGAGLVIVEATAVEQLGRISSNDLGLYSDEQEQALKKLVARIRTFASPKFGIQLAHAGRKASSKPFDSPGFVPTDQGGWIPIGPSPVAHSDRWPTPRAMSRSEIERVVESFAASAARANRAGFDLIEIHGAHGYLISSFLSPVANQRTDEYGGSLTNRMRLAVAAANSVRKFWPADKALGFRLNGTDWVDGGITIEETTELAKVLRDAGVDFVSISSGGNARGQKLPPIIPGYQVFLAEAVRKGAGIKTMAVGMVLTPQQAEIIVANGQSDLIGVARATLDNPRWALHAAQALGSEVTYPKPYWRTAAKNWQGYQFLHDLPTA